MRALGLRRQLILTALFLLFSLLLTENAFAALISVNPTQGPPGSVVTVNGSQWPPGDRIELSWNFPPFNTVASVQADGSGNFTAVITVPSDAPIGPTRVNAINQAGDITWQAEFTVVQASTTTIIFERALTKNGEGTQGEEETKFINNEVIRYAAIVNNPGTGTVIPRFDFRATGPQEIFSWTGDVSISPGRWGFHLHTTVPTDAPVGTYTLRVTMTYNGQTSTKESSFTVTSQHEISYFALGDSIAAGHGLDDDKVDDYGEDDPCRVSLRGYPRKVVGFLEQRYKKVHPKILACSGATVIPPTVIDPRSKWFHYQVDDALTVIENQPSNLFLVSITIGANDFEWADNLWNFVQRFSLNDEETYRAWVDEVVASVKPVISLEVGRLLDQQNVSVILTEVYNPFNKESVFFRLPGTICYPFTNCYERTRYAVAKLNDALISIYDGFGQPERLQITALHGIFGGHESPRSNEELKKCGDASPDVTDTWIQYNGDPNSYSFPDIPLIPGEWRGDCFHPNEKGAQEIAKAVNEDALRVGR